MFADMAVISEDTSSPVAWKPARRRRARQTNEETRRDQNFAAVSSTQNAHPQRLLALSPPSFRSRLALGLATLLLTTAAICESAREFRCPVGEITCASLADTSAASTPTAGTVWGSGDDEPDHRTSSSAPADDEEPMLFHVCIQVDWVCDGNADCPDGEDESHCDAEAREGGETDGDLEDISEENIFRLIDKPPTRPAAMAAGATIPTIFPTSGGPTDLSSSQQMHTNATQSSTIAPGPTSSKSTKSSPWKLSWMSERTLPPLQPARPQRPQSWTLAHDVDQNRLNLPDWRKSTSRIPNDSLMPWRNDVQNTKQNQWLNSAGPRPGQQGDDWLISRPPAAASPWTSTSSSSLRVGPQLVVPLVHHHEPAIVSYDEFKRTSTTTVPSTTVAFMPATTTTTATTAVAPVAAITAAYSRSTARSTAYPWKTTRTSAKYEPDQVPATTPWYQRWKTTTMASNPATTSRYWWEASEWRNAPGKSLPRWMERLRTTSPSGVEAEATSPSSAITITTSSTTTARPKTAVSWKRWGADADQLGTTATIKTTAASAATSVPFGVNKDMTGSSVNAKTEEFQASSDNLANSSALTTFSGSATVEVESTTPSTTKRSWRHRLTSTTSSFVHSATSPSPTTHPSASSTQRTVSVLDELAELKRRLSELETKCEKTLSSSPTSPEMSRNPEDRIARLEEITKKILPASCHELWKLAKPHLPGSYLIDPDGPGVGVAPFTVFCDFSDERGEAITMVEHNITGTIPVGECDGPDCMHATPIAYQATDMQISALKEISRGCHQEIQYYCKSAPLSDTAHWVSNLGERVRYWSGRGDPEVHTCQCGIDIDCSAPADSETDSLCNCDAGSAEIFHDDGILADTARLPVRELHFKGLSAERGQSANFTLGPLKCLGENRQLRRQPFESCRTLRRAGHSASGLYLLRPDGERHLHVAVCDMTLEEDEPGFQEPLDVRIPLDSVVFDAYRVTSLDSKGSEDVVITYENFTVSVGGQMSLADGTFTSPAAGVYAFSFHGLDYSTSRAAIVHLRKNGQVLQVGYSYPAGERGTFGFQSMIELDKGDVVDTTLSGQLFSNSNRLVHFTGMLLRPGVN